MHTYNTNTKKTNVYVKAFISNMIQSSLTWTNRLKREKNIFHLLSQFDSMDTIRLYIENISEIHSLTCKMLKFLLLTFQIHFAKIPNQYFIIKIPNVFILITKIPIVLVNVIKFHHFKIVDTMIHRFCCHQKKNSRDLVPLHKTKSISCTWNVVFSVIYLFREKKTAIK